MQMMLTGTGWPRQVMGVTPIDSYTYHRGDTLRLDAFMERHKGKMIIGMISYDLGYELHSIKPTKPDDLELPDIYFAAYDDYTETKVTGTSADTLLTTPFIPRMNRNEYSVAFDKIKRYIHEGDIYQVNLTHRLEASSNQDGKTLFESINHRHPATMAAYLAGPDFEILSFSPEKFISIKNGLIQTMPIKGTRPRGQEKHLLASEKETAELNMITDLLRNDLGKVSQAGTVKVQAHREIMQLKNISHTYSHITGQLRENISPVKALLSMFPGGSITGCPKKRAMQIIDELEQTTRSAYCGCMVVIDPEGNLDSSILIRTIIKKGTKLILPVGGGVVNDSVEADEYQETLDKASAIITALDHE